MSFDQDPNEQAQISGADLAMLVDEMRRYRAALEQVKFEMEKHDMQLIRHSVIYQIARKALEVCDGG